MHTLKTEQIQYKLPGAQFYFRGFMFTILAN